MDNLKELQLIIQEILKAYSWKKSMKWASYDLNWARPLKSIIALFNNKVVHQYEKHNHNFIFCFIFIGLYIFILEINLVKYYIKKYN